MTAMIGWTKFARLAVVGIALTQFTAGAMAQTMLGLAPERATASGERDATPTKARPIEPSVRSPRQQSLIAAAAATQEESEAWRQFARLAGNYATIADAAGQVANGAILVLVTGNIVPVTAPVLGILGTYGVVLNGIVLTQDDSTRARVLHRAR